MSIWEKIRSSLHTVDYWSKREAMQWSASDYSLFLLQANPSLTRRSVMKLFSEDVEALLVHFDHVKVTKSRLNALKKRIGKDEDLDLFWRDYSEQAKTLSLKRKFNQYAALTAVEEKAVMNLCNETSHKENTFAELTTTTKEVEINNILKTNENNVEYDEVFVDGLETSIGTLIKNKAIEIHEKYCQDIEKCPVDDRKVMSNGLSSILDLCDESINSQYRYFSVNQWNQLKSIFKYLKIQPLPIDDSIKSTLCIITNCYSMEANVDSSLEYVDGMIKNSSLLSPQYTSFAIIKHCLKLIRDYTSMLVVNSPLKYTESDYTYVIWYRLFIKMFPPKSSVIRMKSGESIFDVSTVNKKEVYHQYKSVKGFKIDMRFIIDVNGSEIDIAAAEIAKDDSKEKIISDEGKLVREGKDIVDNLTYVTEGRQFNSRRAYLFQIACNACIVSTLDLARNGLYVATSQINFTLPNKANDFQELEDVLRYLNIIKIDMESTGSIIKNQVNNDKLKAAERLGMMKESKKINECINWTRGTYYTPPSKNNKSEMPACIFGCGPPPSILEKLKEAYESDTGKKYDDNHDESKNYDKYGWKQQEDGKYYNKHTKEIMDNHPLQKIMKLNH